MARKAETRFTAKNETQAAFNSFGASVENFSVKSIAKFTGVQQIIARLTQEITQLPARARAALNAAVEDLDRLAKSGRNVGESARDLDAWEFSAGLARVGTEELAVGLRTLLKNVGDAADGIGEGKIALDKLGISVRDGEGLTKGLNTILFELNTSLQRVSSQSERVAITQRLMGESGGKLLELLGQQPGEFRAIFVEGRKLAQNYTDQADRVEEYQDQLLRMNRELRSVKSAALEIALPALTRLAKYMEDRAGTAVRKFRAEFQEFLATFDLDTSVGGAIGKLEDRAQKYQRALDLVASAQRSLLADSSTARAEFALAAQAMQDLGLRVEDVEEAQRELAALQRILDGLTKKQAAAMEEQARAAARLALQLASAEDRMREYMDAEQEQLARSNFLQYLEDQIRAVEVRVPEAIAAVDDAYIQLSRHAEDFAIRAGNSFSLLVTRGGTAAQILKQLFIDAIRAILAELAALAVFRFLLNIPGLGQAIQVGNAQGGGGLVTKGGPTVVSKAGGASKTGTPVIQILSVTPISSYDQLRSARSFGQVSYGGKQFVQGTG